MNQAQVNRPVSQPQIQVLAPTAQVRAPSIGAAGNPVFTQAGSRPSVTSAEMSKIIQHQKSVKSWGKCFTYFAYFLLVCSWMTLIGNIFCFFIADKLVPPISWYDAVNDKHHRIKLDSYGIGVMCLMKAATSFFSFKQARWTLNVFKPILKEYADAEAGQTQGIQMTERKTKHMKTLQKQIRKLTCGMFAFCLVSIIYCGSWFADQSDRFIQVYYHTQNFPNQTFSDEFFKVENDEDGWTPYNIFGDDEDQEEDDYEFMEPKVDETESDEELNKYAPQVPEEEQKYGGPVPQHPRGGKHHRGFPKKHKADLKDFTNWLDQQANLYGAQQTVRAVIGTMLFFGFIWACVWIAICQGIYLYCIRQVMKKQAILENRFMGAEHPQIQAH